LLTYEDVRQRGARIAQVTRQRVMPPWKPEPGSGHFVGERRLTEQQIATIEEWVRQGAVEGEVSDLPLRPGWTSGWRLGNPDLILEMQPHTLSADGPDVLRSFVIPIPEVTRRYVKGVEFRPGPTRAIHHANMLLDETSASRDKDAQDAEPGYNGGPAHTARYPEGYFLGWTPGQLPPLAAKGMAWSLQPGTDLVLELHLRPTGKPEIVRPSIAFFFTDEAPSRTSAIIRLGRHDIDIPAGERHYILEDSFVLPVDAELYAIQPHAHFLAREVSGFALLPDGSSKPLILIRDWDFDWQDVYRYAEPPSLPKGTTVWMRFVYDNSADNPRNPHRPPRRVLFGQTSSDEMGNLWLQVVVPTARDRQILYDALGPKMLHDDIAGYEKMLVMEPSNAGLHSDLALSYWRLGKTAEARAHYESALRLEPDSASANFDLGTVLLRLGELEAAKTYLERALAIQPVSPETLNTLGAVLHAMGRLDEAIGRYNEALEIEPRHALAHYNLGRALTTQQRLVEAESHYRQSLTINPADAEVRTSLASVLARRGELEAAIPLYRGALEINADLVPALVDLAWILASPPYSAPAQALEAVQLARRAAELTRHSSATASASSAVFRACSV